MLTLSLPTCRGLRGIHPRHARPRDREVGPDEREPHRLRIARSSRLSPGCLAAPYERHAPVGWLRGPAAVCCNRNDPALRRVAFRTMGRGACPTLRDRGRRRDLDPECASASLGLHLPPYPQGPIAARQAAADNPRSSTVERRRANAAASGSCSPSMIRA